MLHQHSLLACSLSFFSSISSLFSFSMVQKRARYLWLVRCNSACAFCARAVENRQLSPRSATPYIHLSFLLYLSFFLSSSIYLLTYSHRVILLIRNSSLPACLYNISLIYMYIGILIFAN